jgi:hypothetical protein
MAAHMIEAFLQEAEQMLQLDPLATGAWPRTQLCRMLGVGYLGGLGVAGQVVKEQC